MTTRIFFLAVLFFHLFSFTAGAETPKVRLGFVTDMSGPVSYWGKQAVLGLQLAKEDIEKEGGSLEPVLGDHSFKPTAAITESQKLVALDNVDALWVEFSPTAIAASHIAVTAKKLFLNNSAATSILKTNPFAFKAFLDFERGCAAIAEHWKSKGFSKIGMLKLNAEFAELCFRGASSVYEDILVMPYEFSESVSSQVLKMKAAGVEAILNPAFEADMLNLMKAMKVINYHVPIGVSEPDSLTASVKTQYPEMLEGVTSFGFPHISKAFLSKFAKRFPENALVTVEAAAMAYIHARQIFNAVSSCPEKEIACIMDVMEKSQPDPTLGFIRWENRIAVYQFLLKEWRNGNQNIVNVQTH